MAAGHAEVAKTILVITSSLCRWHGSKTFTGWRRAFRKEADLLVVSQAACSMPRDIFFFFFFGFRIFSNASAGKFQGVHGVRP